ncbi:hypothetical protein OAN307_c35980 [Octadecabacter antarcticus 307]|uniref:Uncharacterized protein n=1 Tax=Octadecabacter antarcticus 307 TaxID=391626 RepID=M9RF85_9RHOB|nr:hypothetical protein [Octadecabacter antarcticus]AGI69071.1 hypothetical protein OAN307_c35980 [Octadecabacter antarcticus 307]
MCIERNHPKVSVRRQCQMLSLARSNLYYAPKGESAENLRFMELIDKQFLETPWYGSRHPLMHTPYALPGSEWHDTCSVMVTHGVAIAFAA